MAIPALPTIDVTYWIKKLIRGSLLVVVNPYRLFITMSVAIGVLVSSVCAFFGTDYLHSILPVLNFEDSSFLSLVCYVTAWDVLYQILDSVLTFVELLIPFSIASVSSFVGIALLYAHSTAFANMISFKAGTN